MTDYAKNEANARWLEYLQAMQALSAEMQAALAALAANDLVRFEASLAAQELLCESARGLAKKLLRGDSRPTAQLAAAGHELRQQNRVYATVVGRAAQVCAALLSLYQDSPRGYSADGRTLPGPATWSCEV